MTDKTPHVSLWYTWLLPLALLLLVAVVGCSGSRAGRDLQGDETRHVQPRFATNPPPEATDSSRSTQSDTHSDADRQSKDSPAQTAQKSNNNGRVPTALQSRTNNVDEDPEYGLDVESEDFWSAMQQAEDYYSMGCVANRDGSWEEAQYYFEKALKTLADVDVETDSSLTPEAVKYNTLLDNIVSDYRITLRSLGRLDENAAPSAIVERFGDLEEKLDSMVVTTGEVPAVTYDLPVVLNDRVKKSIVYLQSVANKAFTRYLTRQKRYASLFKSVLTQYGLPQDLVYLCLIESGYNPHAYSWARAMGLWQFIASTGRLYGLERNWWIDERKDPVKATHAAARFLKDLYQKFGSWDLAMAAYNGGPGRVERTCAAQKTNDFWKLRLRQQTMDYVPLIYAAAIIAKEPEKYGFIDVTYDAELQWDEVQVSKSLDLNVVARTIGCSVDDLKELNPELLRNVTPPNTKNYALKVPAGMREKFLAAYDDMPQAKASQFVKHKVKRKETLARIANKYGVSQYAILEANNLPKGIRLKAGMTLIVPVPVRSSSTSRAEKNTDKAGDQGKQSLPTSGGIYTVRDGDTMWDIAKAYGITSDELRRINFLGPNAHLKIGQKLKIPSYATKSGRKVSAASTSVAEGSDIPSGYEEVAATEPVPVAPVANSQNKPGRKSNNPKIYIVKSGDTISELAARFGMTPAQLRTLNKLGRGSKIFVGQRLRVYGGDDSGEYLVYQVRRGDTLGRIAQRYNTTVSKIMADNNNIDPTELRVGSEIKISVD